MTFVNSVRGIRFDRNELAGAFGDMGTDFPLLVGMILASGLDVASTLIMFGLMQVVTGLMYGVPIPVQPLKAMAALVIAQKYAPNLLYGAGFSIGVIMLLLTLTRSLDLLNRLIPKCVIRGIQLGLGIQLALLSLKDYVPKDGFPGYVLAAMAFFIVVFLRGNRRFPASLVVIACGIVYALVFKMKGEASLGVAGFALPKLHLPSGNDILAGFFLLALPQIPLSLGNSIFATRQLSQDLFPERKLTVGKIGLTYSLMNLLNPFFSGVPTCHGAGGMAGHYAFGGRTGGSVILYGSMYLILGLFLSRGFTTVVKIFPLPILGIILFFESLALATMIKDLFHSIDELWIALMVGVIANGLSYGFLFGLVIGTSVYYLKKLVFHPLGNKREAI